MRYRFIDDHRGRWPVRTVCSVPRVSPSGYYAWRDRPASDRAQRRGQLTEKVHQIFQDSRQTYGSPRVHRQLKRQGHHCSVHTAAKLMQAQGPRAKGAKRFKPRATDSGHRLAVAQNRPRRGSTAASPNRVWVADITYIPTRVGWLYLAVVLDVFSRMVVGWSIADHLRADPVCQALRTAIARRRPDEGLVHHSDRGCGMPAIRSSGSWTLTGSCAA